MTGSSQRRRTRLPPSGETKTSQEEEDMFKRIWAVSFLASIALSPGLVQAQTSEPYVIGLTGDLSGPSAGTYKPLAEGARIYIDALNAKGGINGHQIKLV